MHEKTLTTLEFDKVLARLARHTSFSAGRELALAGVGAILWSYALEDARGSELPRRPPGALPGDDFLAACIKCGQCLKVCLTGGLQPAITEAGLSGLWTPHLVSRLGDCAFECNLCGRVCPSGAIPNLPLEEKKLFI